MRRMLVELVDRERLAGRTNSSIMKPCARSWAVGTVVKERLTLVPGGPGTCDIELEEFDEANLKTSARRTSCKASNRACITCMSVLVAAGEGATAGAAASTCSRCVEERILW